MNAWQNYLSMFTYLSEFYFHNKNDYQEELDALGGLLGDMNPYLFADGIPADQALLDDWLNNIGGKQG
jgi:hypothetical protein